MKRDDAHRRIRDVEREFEAASWALGAALESVRLGDAVLLPSAVTVGDVKRTAERLEITYVVRLFAEFEWILRDFWSTYRATDPPARDLIEGVARANQVSQDWIDRANGVREYRNKIIHEGLRGDPQTFVTCRSALARFLSALPLQW